MRQDYGVMITNQGRNDTLIHRDWTPGSLNTRAIPMHNNTSTTLRYNNNFLIEIFLLKEAELVYTTFHNWIRQALQLGLKENKDGALLIDLHGHGHPHEYIELGFRLSASLLNNIANEEEETRYKRMSFLS